MPSYQEEGIRIEMFGDEIDSLSKIDPVTGKQKVKLERVVVYPAKHFITTGPKIKDAIEKIKAEMYEQKAKFLEMGKHLEAERIESRTNYDMEMLLELGYCSGIENYSRHLTGRSEGERPACLLDYFPNLDFLLMIDESHVTLPQIGGMYAGDSQEK